MPNWCLNTLTITADPNLVPTGVDYSPIEKLIVANNTEEHFLQHMRPMPDELKETTAPNDSGINWYNWRVENWGTKWEVSADVDWDEETKTLHVTFDSAWAPPIEALQYWADQHPEFCLELSYWEPGMAFVGSWSSLGADEHYNYAEYTSKTVREHIPDYLVDHWALEDELRSIEEMNEEEE